MADPSQMTHRQLVAKVQRLRALVAAPDPHATAVAIRYAAMMADYHAWADVFAPMVMGMPEQPELAITFARTMAALPPATAHVVARIIFQSDYRWALPEVPTPTLLIQATQDVAVPLDVAQYLAQHLPHATLQMGASPAHERAGRAESGHPDLSRQGAAWVAVASGTGSDGANATKERSGRENRNKSALLSCSLRVLVSIAMYVPCTGCSPTRS